MHLSLRVHGHRMHVGRSTYIAGGVPGSEAMPAIGEIARSQAPRAADNFRSVKHGNHAACFCRAARKTSI